MHEQRLKSSITTTKPIADTVIVEKTHGKSGASKRPKVPITATPYTVASLQLATNSFSQDFLVGEGSFGRVYRAELPNGKVILHLLCDKSLSFTLIFYFGTSAKYKLLNISRPITQ